MYMFKKTLVIIVKTGMYASLLMPFVVTNLTLYPYVFGKALFFQSIIELIFPFWLALALWHPEYRPRFANTDGKSRGWKRYCSLNSAVLVFFASLVISALFSSYPTRSFWGTIERMTGVYTMLHFGALYFMLVTVFKTRIQWVRYLRSLIAVGGLVSGFMIYTGISHLGERSQGWFGNPGIAGSFLLFLIFFILIAFFLERTERSGKIVSIFYGASFFTAFAALIFNGTRAVFVGIIVAVLIGFFGFPLWRRQGIAGRRIVIILWISGVLFTAFIALAVSNRLPSVFYDKVLILSRARDITLKDNLRTAVWLSGLEGWKILPFFGYGRENFAIPFNKHYKASIAIGRSSYYLQLDFDKAHNEFIEYLVTTGIVGFVAWLAIFIVALRRLFRHRRESIINVLLILLFAAYLSHLFFTFDTLVSLFMLWIAFAFAESYPELVEKKTVVQEIKKRSDNAGGRVVLITIISVTSVVLFSLGIRSAVASHFAMFVEFSVKERDFGTAMFFLDRALSYNSQYSFYFIEKMGAEILNIVDTYDKNQKGSVFYLIKRMKEIERNNWHAHVLIARMYNFLCNEQKNYCNDALQYLQSAQNLAPDRSSVYAERYITFNILQEYTKAKNEADRALLLGYNPSSPSVLINLGFIYGYNKEYKRSLEFYQEALQIQPENLDILKSIIFLADKIGDSDMALAAAQKAVVLDPSLRDALARYLKP